MFEGLSGHLSGIFEKLTRRGALSEADVTDAMREVRRALLEADVALDVVRDFIEKVRLRAIGTEVIKSVTPGQMVIKIVHDEMVRMLGLDAAPISLQATPPVGILMVGLQGSGKTTSSAKIALRLGTREKKKVLMASLDTRRPAAMEQLAVLGRDNGIDVLPIIAGQSALEIAKRAEEEARRGGYDVVLYDTAGRTTLDDALMDEVVAVKAAITPHEVLLVADSLTGQDAVNTASAFNARVGLTGIVLTRVDGDGRGGAALSMRAITGKPIKLMGVGEKMDALEDFHPARIANRILGMGDIVSLVEKAAASLDQDQALAMAEKMRKGRFDLADLRDQLRQMEKLGGLSGLMGMMPGIGKMKDQMANAGVNEKMLARQVAIINSMTPGERKNPDILKASRKKRIAAGSGTSPEEINKLLKMHRSMADMMKSVGQGKRGPMAGLATMFGMGGGFPGGAMPPGGMPALPPGAVSPEKLAEAEKQLAQLSGPGKPVLPGLGKAGLPGLGGGLPGLGGFNPFRKK